MKKKILFPLPFLLLASFEPAIGWKNGWLGPTFNVSLDPYVKDTAYCDGGNFLPCYKTILEYIETGSATIRISNATDAVMVIGLTRVGRSTVTQFVANYSNPLVVECQGPKCHLLDDSANGGNDVISKTFVPNTVEHSDSNGVTTLFYDMPGFDDSKGVAIEIASSFFIQKVIKGIQRIKIVVVAKHTSFSSTETSFRKLMRHLIKFTKTPEKFKDSIVLIANMGHYDLPDEAHFETYKIYMDKYNSTMDYGDSHPPQDIPIVRGWMNSFAEADINNPAELTNVALLRAAHYRLNGTSIREDEIFEADYQRMKKIIWERTSFSSVTNEPIGLTLSLEADKFLDDATLEASKDIKKKIFIFTTDIEEHLQWQLRVITESFSEDEMTKFLANYNLIKLDFQECNSLPESSPQVCVNQIRSVLFNLAVELGSDVFDEIHTMAEFLQFAYADVNKSKEYDMAEWVSGLKQIPLNLENGIQLKTCRVSNEVRIRLTNLSTESGVYLEKLVADIESATESEMDNFLNHFHVLKALETTECSSHPESPPQACVKQTRSQISNLANDMGSAVFDEINAMTVFLQFAYDNLNNSKEYDMTEWVSGFKQIPPNLEKDIKLIVEQRSNGIRVRLGDFSNQVGSYLGKLVQNISESASQAEMNTFLTHFYIVKTLNTTRCGNSRELSPEGCINQISIQISGLANEMNNTVFDKISPMVKFLQFSFTHIEPIISYDMTEWKNVFSGIPNFVEQKASGIADEESRVVSEYFRNSFSTQTRTYFQIQLQQLKYEPMPDDDDLMLLNNTITELSLVKPGKFDFCKKQGSPMACYQEILEKLNCTINATRSSISENLVNPVTFLEFIYANFGNIYIDVRDWISIFDNLQITVGEDVEAAVQAIYEKEAVKAEILAYSISDSILSNISKYTTIEEVTQHLRENVSLLDTINEKFLIYGEQASLSGYIDLIIKEYSKIEVKYQDTSILRLNIILMIEKIKWFSWHYSSSYWRTFHKLYLTEPISAEYSVFQFLLDLYSDLQSYAVQSENALHDWRMLTSEVNKRNFDAFWTKLHQSNIKAMTTHKINQGTIKNHIGLNKYSRDWLNQALDHTLLWKSACPTSTMDVTLFKGRYMTLGFVKSCLEKQSKISKKIVVLSDETFFFDDDIDLTDKLNTKVQIFVMSRHFDMTKQGNINIEGRPGDPPPNKPGGTGGTFGKNGENGVDIFGVYLSMNGSNVNVDSCGGDGGNGQDGGDGGNSADTDKPSFNYDSSGLIPESQCSAWSGRVKVHIYPNSCNRNSATDGGCGAPDDGAWVAVWGAQPGTPIFGGMGGYGGDGGMGGLSAMLDVSVISPRVEIFSNGRRGEHGRKGIDGVEGKRSAICVNIDDKNCGSCGRRRCYLKNAGEMDFHCRGFTPRGVVKTGNAGINTTGIVSLSPIGQDRLARARCTSSASNNYNLFGDFKEYTNTFYKTASLHLNIFNRNTMTVFLNYVKNHELLLKGEVF